MIKKLLLLLVVSTLSLSPVAHAGFFKNAWKAAEARAAEARAVAARVAQAARERAAQIARENAARIEAARKAAEKAARERAARIEAARIAAEKAAKRAAERAARKAAKARAKAKRIASAKAKAAAALLAAEHAAAKKLLEEKLGISLDFIDEGDYGPLQILANLKTAPKANNPVNAALEDEMYFMDFNRNPSGHNDGFNAKRYHQWQVITLDGKTTGAQCADGSDYKFLVKRSASSSNMVVFFEAGGGCWDYDTCSVSSGGFTNAGLVGGLEGTPEVGNLKTEELGIRAAKLASLTTGAIQPGFNPRYKNWTRVFLPYCTQDIHLGMENDDITYHGEGKHEGKTMDVRHRGMSIQGSVLTWLKDNLEQPSQLLVTGQSAGGFASELLYHPYRLALAPKKGYMLNDAGPIMRAPQGEDAHDYPSQFAHETVTAAWNAMPYLKWLEEQSQSHAHFDPLDMGTISDFLSSRWHNDRFTLVAAQKDNVIAGFSYNTFFPQISDESSLKVRDELRDQLRFTDMDRKRSQLDAIDNYGYFMPAYRPFMGGHVLTFPFIWSSTTNEEDGKHVVDAIHSLMKKRGGILASWEHNLTHDLNGQHYGKPLDDCINYYSDVSNSGMTSGDVYLHEDASEGTNWNEIINDVITQNACLRLGFDKFSIMSTIEKFIPDL